MNLSLGLDISTQSLTAIAIDPSTPSIVALEAVNYGRDLPHYKAPNGFVPGYEDVPGAIGANPRMWLDALELLFHRLSKKVALRHIRAICGSGQQHGSVYLTRSFPLLLRRLSPFHPLSSQLSAAFARQFAPIWMDTSTTLECREIAERLGGPQAVCQRCGSIPIERFTGPQIRRFAKAHPQRYERTAHIALVSSFIASVLAGRIAPIDRGDGAGMNLLNLHTVQWDPALADATAPNLLQRLPPLDPSNSVIGKISDFFVHKFGFRPDTRIVTFTGDNPASLVGMGATSPGRVVISLGTSDTFFAAIDQPLTDPDGYGHVFGNPGGAWMTLQCFVNGSLARERIRDICGYDWHQFDRALREQTSPGNNGNVMLPFFLPEISPRLDIHEPLLDGSPEFVARRDLPALVRACVEGQFLNMRMRVKWMQLSTKEILLTGGASRSDGIAQVIADVFQATVRRLAISNSAALGAAMLAARAALGKPLDQLQATLSQPDPGTITPNPSAAPTYTTIEPKLISLLTRAQKP